MEALLATGGDTAIAILDALGVPEHRLDRPQVAAIRQQIDNLSFPFIAPLQS